MKIASKWIVFSIVATGTFMATLDSSIVNVALPSLVRQFGAGVNELKWVVTVYLLTISATLPAFGRLGDLAGRSRIYAMGLVTFVLGSALCGLAPSLEFLVGARVIQALGASMAMSNGMAIIVSTFPPTERGRVLGLSGSVVSAGSLTGPTLGGILVGTVGWRWIFFVNLPIGLAAYFIGRKLLPGFEKRAEKFDFAGSALFAGGVTALLLGLSFASDLGFGSPVILALIAAAIGLLGAFIAVERRVPYPVINLELFKNRLFFFGNLAGLISFVAIFFAIFLMPFYLTNVLGLEPGRVGLLMTPFPASMILVAPISGWLSDRMGPSLLTTGGMAVIALGLFVLSQLTPESSLVAVALSLALVGTGTGLFQSPNNSSVMGSVSPRTSGVASGMLATVRNIGMMTGVALAASILSFKLPPLPMAEITPEAFVRAFSQTLQVGAVIATAGIAVATVRGREALRKSD